MTTFSKENLGPQLQQSYADVIKWINEQPEDLFNTEIVAGKWTTAGHLYHLIKSNRAVNKGMAMPKLALRTMFGKCNREERTYEGLKEKYLGVLAQNGGIKAPKEFAAEEGRVFEKAALIKRFEEELEDTLKTLNNWSEEDLSTYILPHPAIGKLTFREICYFMIYHNSHHLNILKEQYQAVS